VKQIPDNEIFLLIKYIKSGLWGIEKRLSYAEEARCLKVKYQYITHWKGPKLNTVALKRMDHFGGMNAEAWMLIKSILKTGCECAVFIEPTQNKGLLHDL
jgi:hypothetical protein